MHIHIHIYTYILVNTILRENSNESKNVLYSLLTNIRTNVLLIFEIFHFVLCLTEHRLLLTPRSEEIEALLSVYRALLNMYRALLSVYRTLSKESCIGLF